MRQRPIETTGQLTEIIKAAIPAKIRAVGGHPFAVVVRRNLRQEAEHEGRTFVFCHISQV